MNSLDRNLRFGWWSLLVFLSLGGVLEILHGFKIGWYVDVGSDMRQLMFTLAHAQLTKSRRVGGARAHRVHMVPHSRWSILLPVSPGEVSKRSRREHPFVSV